MTGNGQPAAGAETKILHISDLHFGFRFDQDAWNDFCQKAKTEELRPHLLLITGDLVNSPTFWRLHKARREVNKLKTELNCEVLVVPGNHDTRFLGIIPVKWIHPAALAVMVTLSLVAYFFYRGSLPAFLATWVVLATLIILRSCFIDFKKSFKDFIVEGPVAYPAWGLEIYPFDSASLALSGARGKIRKREFVNIHKEPTVKGPPLQASEAEAQTIRAEPYRMAILHHHPLPIPYDHAHEPLMVIDNAGAFLSEVSNKKIRLILHGHKHNRHFARVTINAGRKDGYEIAVLSTGTPTAGRGESRFGHNFNFLRLDSSGNVCVIPYVASSGAFRNSEGEHFFIEQPDMADKRLHEGLVQNYGRKCALNVVMAEIGADGDMYWRREYHGLQVMRDYLNGMPYDTEAKIATGHIQGFEADKLVNSAPEDISLTEDAQNTLTHQKGRIKFGRSITPEDKPLNFFCHYNGLNAFAMSAYQHREMYGTNGNFTEWIELELDEIPTEELSMVVKFPSGFRIEGEPSLLVEQGDHRLTALERKYENNIRYFPRLNVIIVRIEHPFLPANYKIRWALTAEPPPSGSSSSSISGAVKEIADRLLRLSSASPAYQELIELLKTIEEKTRSKFRLPVEDEIEVSLMAYDKTERVLKIVAANFPLDPPVRDFKLRYGNGIAGRAYKMNKGRMFLKEAAIRKETPSYYYPLDGKPYKLEDIDEAVIISIPLRHPKNKELVYAILNLSSKDPSSRLQDINKSSVLDGSSAFREGVNVACFEVMQESILRRSI